MAGKDTVEWNNADCSCASDWYDSHHMNHTLGRMRPEDQIMWPIIQNSEFES